MLYFGYGSNLDRAVFQRSCPGAEWFGAARLEDFRFTISAGGHASVKPEVGAVVWGGLWLVPGGELAELDTSPDAPDTSYERATRRIVSPAGPRTEATLYLSTGAAEGRPSAAYLEALIAAAKKNKLPATYVKELESWRSKTA